MVPFCTNAQVLERVDWRWVANQLLDSTTVASASSTPPTYAQLIATNNTAGARLQQLITDASEKLMAAAAVGARYTEDDVRTYGGNLVLSIVSGLSIGPILQRRVRAVSDESSLNLMYSEALDYVEQLRRGERIFFAVPHVPEAGLPGHPTMEPRPPQPPSLTEQSGRYFGCPAAGPGYPGGNPYYPNYPPYTG